MSGVDRPRLAYIPFSTGLDGGTAPRGIGNGAFPAEAPRWQIDLIALGSDISWEKKGGGWVVQYVSYRYEEVIQWSAFALTATSVIGQPTTTAHRGRDRKDFTR